MHPEPSQSMAINLFLHGQSCLIVGGGAVALRRTRTLLACRADVTVVSPTFEPELREMLVDLKNLIGGGA